MARIALFDFDGTIADTVAVGVSTFNELAGRYGFVEITSQNAYVLRGKSPRQAMKALEVPLYRVPLIVRNLRRGVRAALPSLRAAEGMRDAILKLRDQGYRLGIVTSNSEENVKKFLEENDMNCFDYIAAGSGIFRKSVAIKKLIVRHALRNGSEDHDIVFIGDEIRDVEAAKKNDMRVVAVTWGINSREGLASADPNFIVDTPEELLSVI